MGQDTLQHSGTVSHLLICRRLSVWPVRDPQNAFLRRGKRDPTKRASGKIQIKKNHSSSNSSMRKTYTTMYALTEVSIVNLAPQVSYVRREHQHATRT